MYDSTLLAEMILDGKFDNEFKTLYQRAAVSEVRSRYTKAAESFCGLYGSRPSIMVSVPGRSEIIGNHTDHQNGCVLAAAVDLDIICIASENKGSVVRITSEGYSPFEVDLSDLTPVDCEKGTSAALVRGIAAWLAENGYKVRGFDAYATSDVLTGSGLSSSAAFEVAIGNIFAALYNLPVSPLDIAKAGQYAENKYLGKPSGLMDQTACSVGSLVFIDFIDSKKPLVSTVDLILKQHSLKLLIIDTKGSHENLNDEYAAIPAEMCAVAKIFGKNKLREVSEEEFYSSLKRVRDTAGDRALLRAMHFFAENRRVSYAADAVRGGNIDAFLTFVNLSGKSSMALLQNISTTADPAHQELAAALALSEYFLSGLGATRVHGGGFAGTIQAFVPNCILDEYKAHMAEIFGEDAIYVLNIRSIGGYVYGRNQI